MRARKIFTKNFGFKLIKLLNVIVKTDCETNGSSAALLIYVKILMFERKPTFSMARLREVLRLANSSVRGVSRGSSRSISRFFSSAARLRNS